MKLFIAALVLGSCVMARADDDRYIKTQDIKGKEVTKLEVLRTLFNDPKAEFLRCSQVEMTNKATLRKK